MPLFLLCCRQPCGLSKCFTSSYWGHRRRFGCLASQQILIQAHSEKYRAMSMRSNVKALLNLLHTADWADFLHWGRQMDQLTRICFVVSKFLPAVSFITVIEKLLCTIFVWFGVNAQTFSNVSNHYRKLAPNLNIYTLYFLWQYPLSILLG